MRWASSACASSAMPRGGGIDETAHTSVSVAPSASSAARRSDDGASGGRAEIGLGEDEHVGDLHDACLQELEDVAGRGLQDDRDGIGRVGHVGLGLAHADGLDHDHVERGRERFRRGPGGGGEAAEARARGGRANEHVAVLRIGLDPGSVAQQRPT